MNGPPAGATTAGGFFSLQDERLKLSGEGYSPGLLKKIEYAGGNSRSFETAAESLTRLAELPISAKHVQRLTERLGKERAAERDAAAAAMKDRKLRAAYKQAPTVAVIMVDAGKAQFRQEDKGPGVHGAHWGDTKVACLQTYTKVECDKDPQPEPPESFLDPIRVERLCREMQQIRGSGADKQAKEETKDPQPVAKKQQEKRKDRKDRPQRLVRTVVATTAAVEEFGWIVSAEAMDQSAGATALLRLGSDSRLSPPAGASVRRGAAGARQRRRRRVEAVRGDVA